MSASFATITSDLWKDSFTFLLTVTCLGVCVLFFPFFPLSCTLTCKLTSWPLAIWNPSNHNDHFVLLMKHYKSVFSTPQVFQILQGCGAVVHGDREWCAVHQSFPSYLGYAIYNGVIVGEMYFLFVHVCVCVCAPPCFEWLSIPLRWEPNGNK